MFAHSERATGAGGGCYRMRSAPLGQAEPERARYRGDRRGGARRGSRGAHLDQYLARVGTRRRDGSPCARVPAAADSRGRPSIQWQSGRYGSAARLSPTRASSVWAAWRRVGMRSSSCGPGADAVQVGTATFRDPRAPWKVLRELGAVVREEGNNSGARCVPPGREGSDRGATTRGSQGGSEGAVRGDKLRSAGGGGRRTSRAALRRNRSVR